MASITQKELMAINDIVSSHQLMAAKLSTYSSNCQDQNIKQMFSKASFEASESAQNLINQLQ